MEMESPLVVNSPKEGLLFKNLDGVVHFELRKTIAEPVAFKVLSRFPQIYRVNPNFGVIEGPVGRTKSISVNLNSSHDLLQSEVTGLANDALLIDAIRVCDVQSDAPAPKKPNKSAQAFDWSKVEDRSRVITLRIRSKLDLLLKIKLMKEIAEKDKQRKAAEEQNKAEVVPVSKESQSEEKEGIEKVEERKPREETVMECEGSQQIVDENGTMTVEMTLVTSEPEGEKLPEKSAASYLANFIDDIRKIEARAAPANHAIRLLDPKAERALPPLFGIVKKVFTAAQYRNAVRLGEQFYTIDG